MSSSRIRNRRIANLKAAVALAEEEARAYFQEAVNATEKATEFALAKNAAESERDTLRQALEAERLRATTWRGIALANGEKADRLRRHREVLLDTMIAAEERGVDYGPQASLPREMTNEVKP